MFSFRLGLIISVTDNIISHSSTENYNNTIKISDNIIKMTFAPSYFIMPRDFVFRSGTFPLGVKKINDQDNCDYHIHEDYYELVVISKGHATHIIDGMRYAVGPGDVFVILDGCIHAYDDIQDIEVNNVLFDWKKLNLPLYDFDTLTGFQFLFKIDPQSKEKNRFDQRFRLNANQLAETMNLIDLLDQELLHESPGYRVRSISLFYQLLLRLVGNYSYQAPDSGRDTIPHRIGELVSSMEKDCSQPFSVQDMCRRTNMSQAGLFRQFQKYFHDTPLNFLQNIRLEHAAQMLINTDLTVSEIAMMTGYADSSYFARKFKESNGVTPKDFRSRFA